MIVVLDDFVSLGVLFNERSQVSDLASYFSIRIGFCGLNGFS